MAQEILLAAVNEKYSSVQYMLSCPIAQVSFIKGFEGYLGLNKIADKNSTAVK